VGPPPPCPPSAEASWLLPDADRHPLSCSGTSAETTPRDGRFCTANGVTNACRLLTPTCVEHNQQEPHALHNHALSRVLGPSDPIETKLAQEGVAGCGHTLTLTLTLTLNAHLLRSRCGDGRALRERTRGERQRGVLCDNDRKLMTPLFNFRNIDLIKISIS
jgi:hypothetical protein